MRGARGTEDLKQTSFLFIGLPEEAQRLLTSLCYLGPPLFVNEDSLLNLRTAHLICEDIRIWENESVDVVIDFRTHTLTIYGHQVRFDEIGPQDSYTQGIHDMFWWDICVHNKGT